MRISGRQEVMEAHMQNESCPRRARRREAHRRGSQQAGRIGRAKGKRDRSFCGLQMAISEIERANYRARGNRSISGVLNFLDELRARQDEARLPSRHHAFGRANRASERFLRQILVAAICRDRMFHSQQVSQLATFCKGATCQLEPTNSPLNRFRVAP